MTVISFKDAAQKLCYAELDALGSKLGRKIFEYTITHLPSEAEVDAVIEKEIVQFKDHLIAGGIVEQDIEIACLRLRGRIIDEGLTLLHTLPDDGGTLQ